MSISTSDAATAVVDKADFFPVVRCIGGAGAAPSGAADAERDDAAVELASVAFALRFPDVREPDAGALIDKAGNLGSESAASAAVASSESFSPTHARANQRPPAIPRISRCAGRQCRGLPLVRSSGVVGA